MLFVAFCLIFPVVLFWISKFLFLHFDDTKRPSKCKKKEQKSNLGDALFFYTFYLLIHPASEAVKTIELEQIDLEVLLEVHNQDELEKSLMPTLDLLGVNNRDLRTFEVSLETSHYLASKIPDDFVKVSESGISKVETIQELKASGYQGFLVGENFMKTDNPGAAAQTFIKQLEA